MKKVLSIAGSDCSGGAGIQADLKTFSALKCYGMSAITALTAQNTTGVFSVSEVATEFIAAQMEACFSDIFPDSVKIGMISSEQIAKCVAQNLQKWGAKNIVLDPVMVATSGGVLADKNAVKAVIDELLPLASVITPNAYEAGVLAGFEVKNIDDMKKAIDKIAELTPSAILVKGGDINSKVATDLLYFNGEITELCAARIDTKNTHGTGCTLSSAIACGLANDLGVVEAVKEAKSFVHKALSFGLDLGRGNGPLNHCF